MWSDALRHVLAGLDRSLWPGQDESRHWQSGLCRAFGLDEESKRLDEALGAVPNLGCDVCLRRHCTDCQGADLGIAATGRVGKRLAAYRWLEPPGGLQAYGPRTIP